MRADGGFQTALGSGGRGPGGTGGQFQSADPVTGVGEFDEVLVTGGFVGEQERLKQRRVEMFQTESGGNVLVEGEEKGEPFDGAAVAGGAAAEVVEPDQSVGEGGVRIGDGRREEGGPAAGSEFDQGAGIGGRQGVFEVRTGGEFGDAPAGELTPERAVELFAIAIAEGTQLTVLEIGARRIDEFELAFAAEESAGGQAPAAGGGGFDAGHRECGGAFGVPGEELEAAVAFVELPVSGPEEERFGAGLEEEGLRGEEVAKLFDGEHQ